MQKKPDDPCDICESKPAMLVCEVCTKNHRYCTDCYKTSHNNESRKQHVVILISDVSKSFSSFDEVMLTMSPDENCSKHPKRAIEYACKKCGIAICSDCLLVGAHKGHDAVSFEEGWSELVERAPLIERKLQNEYDMIKREFKGIQEMKENQDKDYKVHAKKIVEALDKIVLNLQDKKVELLSSLKEQNEKQAAEVEKAYMQLVHIDAVLEKRNEIVRLMKDARSPALYNSIKAAEDFKLPEVTKKVCKKPEEAYSLGGISDLQDSIKDMRVYKPGEYEFTTKHHDFKVSNDGRTVERTTSGTLDLPVYSKEGYSNGIHVMKIKIDRLTYTTGLGVHLNNTDPNSYSGPFLFSNGSAYGGLAGTYAQGDEVTMTLDFEKCQFRMTSKTLNTSVVISKQKYYFAAEIYGVNDKISIVE